MDENSVIKKSIFRQKTYAKRFFVKYRNETYNGMYAVFEKNMEDIAEDERQELVEEKTIFTCDLSLPLLQYGDKFYIDELDMMITIQDSYRTSKDAIVYYIDDKYIKDEESENTYNKAMEQIGNCEKMKTFIEEVKNNKVYQNKVRCKMKSELR